MEQRRIVIVNDDTDIRGLLELYLKSARRFFRLTETHAPHNSFAGRIIHG